MLLSFMVKIILYYNYNYNNNNNNNNIIIIIIILYYYYYWKVCIYNIECDIYSCIKGNIISVI